MSVDVVSLDSLARNEKYKARPGTKYALVPGDTVQKPAVLGVLNRPTDTLVAAYDELAQEQAEGNRTLEKLMRSRVNIGQKLAAALAGETPEGLDLDEWEKRQEENDKLIVALDPTNPKSARYYVTKLRQQAAVALTCTDAAGEPVDLATVEGVETLVLDTAVSDFLGLAFKQTDARR